MFCLTGVDQTINNICIYALHPPQRICSRVVAFLGAHMVSIDPNRVELEKIERNYMNNNSSCVCFLQHLQQLFFPKETGHTAVENVVESAAD